MDRECESNGFCVTPDTGMKRPGDNVKTLVQRPDLKAKGVTREAFLKLMQALEDVLAFERGERRDLQVTRIRANRPPESNVTKQ